MSTPQKFTRARAGMRRPWLILVLLSITSAACRPESPNEQAAATIGALASSDSSLRCVADAARSETVEYQPVDLGEIARKAERQELILRGPKTSLVIRDSSQWAAAWRQAVDTVAPPAVHFGSDALILVGTKTYGQGPSRLAVEAVRRCRTNGAIVIATRETWPHAGGEDYGSRGLAVVRVPRDVVTNAPVIFVELPEKN
jgi:hypothetical protein